MEAKNDDHGPQQDDNMMYKDIQKQIKLREGGLGEEDDYIQDGLFKKKKKRVQKLAPTDKLRAAAFTINKDLSKSFYNTKEKEHCIKDKRNVTELITTVKHTKRQGWPELASYHCEKVGAGGDFLEFPWNSVYV